MSSGLIYTSGYLFEGKQTGGIKRLCVLAQYSQKFKNYDVCCADSDETLSNNNITSKYKIKQEKITSVLPPEANRLIVNRKIISSIRNRKYDNVIVFDVPAAIGLFLFGVKNVCLMIRKDMIGYEIVSNKISFHLIIKIVYQWICESICILNSKSIICQCYYDRDVLIRRHRICAHSIKKKTKIQINNVDPEWIVRKSNLQLKNEDLINTGFFNVCFIGDFDDDRKGHNQLLIAAKELCSQNENICFHIIGGGKKLDFYRSRSINERIIFYGKVDNPIKILKQCDLVIVPSLADSCPNTVLEALYNEIPVIGSNRGGIPEILKHKEMLFNPNHDEITQIISSIRNDRTKLRRIKEYVALRKEELSFNWAEKIVEIVEG